ncbi:MAG: hypothetical protein AAB628_02495 [Patescibacteria group bacterium]
MQILTVAPLTRGILHPSLTYFTKNTVSVGAIVMVPVRTREIPALVLEAKEVSDMKGAIKSSDFSVKKILRAKPLNFWSTAFIESAQETSAYFVQPLGETLLALTPKSILDAYMERSVETTSESHPPLNQKKEARIYAIQLSTPERFEDYRRLVRESFAKKQSIFICVPTETDALRVLQALKHGIEEYAFLFHSGVTKNRILSTWESVTEEQHAVLVIGTPQYLLIPRHFEKIILDEEHAHSWKTFTRPFIDTRFFVETYARKTGSTLILGSSILRPETHARIENQEILEWNRVTKHATSNIETVIIDPRIEEQAVKERTGTRTFQVLSKTIRERLEQALASKESVVLITARKGLTPITMCNDCGTIIRCSACENPLAIHKQQGDKRIYSCHACGLAHIPEEGEHETCPNCGGWRLVPLGIGIERVEEEVFENFPHAKRFAFDSERVKTKAQAKKIIQQFEKTKEENLGAVLIATPMAIPYLTSVDHSIIISIDSLFAIPDYRMNERIFALILSLREKSKKSLLIQTRTDDTAMIEFALHGRLAEFTEHELALRKTFSYTPYGTIIKITARGEKDFVPKEIESLKNFFPEHALIIPKTMTRDTSIFTKNKKDKSHTYRMHAIIKLSGNVWPDKTAISKLRALPPHFTVEVNPDHLL